VGKYRVWMRWEILVGRMGMDDDEGGIEEKDVHCVG